MPATRMTGDMEALMRERDLAVKGGMSAGMWLDGAIRRVLYPVVDGTRTWGGLDRRDKAMLCYQLEWLSQGERPHHPVRVYILMLAGMIRCAETAAETGRESSYEGMRYFRDMAVEHGLPVHDADAFYGALLAFA